MQTKLMKIAQSQGVTVKELVESLIASHKTDFKAAQSVGMYPNAIRNARERHGIPLPPRQSA